VTEIELLQWELDQLIRQVTKDMWLQHNDPERHSSYSAQWKSRRSYYMKHLASEAEKEEFLGKMKDFSDKQIAKLNKIRKLKEKHDKKNRPGYGRS